MDSSYHHEGLRDALIETGRRILVRDGLAAFSLRGLARELGVSHAAPYRHFSSKEDLVRAIIASDEEAFNAALLAGVEGVSDPHERLYRLGEAYVFFFLDHPQCLTLFFLLPGQASDLGDSLARLFAPLPSDASGYPEDPSLGLLRKASALRLKSFPGLSEAEVIFGCWAKVHGIASLLVGQKGFLPEEGLRSSVSRLVRTAF
jgi:AcrR family transcriptional regulator